MQESGLYQLLKVVGYVVVVAGGAAILYSGYIGVAYWSGIGV